MAVDDVIQALTEPLKEELERLDAEKEGLVLALNEINAQATRIRRGLKAFGLLEEPALAESKPAWKKNRVKPLKEETFEALVRLYDGDENAAFTSRSIRDRLHLSPAQAKVLVTEARKREIIRYAGKGGLKNTADTWKLNQEFINA